MESYRFTTGVQFYWNNRLYEVVRYLAGESRMVRIIEVLTDHEMELSASILEADLFQDSLTFVPKTRVNRNKETSPLPNPEEQKIDLSDYPALYIEKARFRLKVIVPLLVIEPSERTKEMVIARVKEVSSLPENPMKFAVSVRSVYRWMEDYESSGEDIRSLIPNHARSGGPGKSRLDIDLLNFSKSQIGATGEQQETLAPRSDLQPLE